MNKADFHFHSTYSDGKKTVPELAKMIQSQALSVCALTDHNSVDGVLELQHYLSGSGVQVVPGVELTVKFHDDEIHVLALDFDVEVVREILQERNDLVRRNKVIEMKQAIVLSQVAGMRVSKNIFPVEKQPATLTLALDICSHESNQQLFLERHGKQFMPEDVFYAYQAPGKPCAVERSGVIPEWIVERFSGVAKDLVIAHPFVSVSVVTKPLDRQRIESLIDIGMTGIEIYHTKTSDEQIALLQDIVKQRSLRYSGGSDFHGRDTDPLLGQYGGDRDIVDYALARYGHE